MGKSTLTPLKPQPSHPSKHGVTGQHAARQASPPPAYRPQPTPKCLQAKTALPPRVHAPDAPAVYRSQPLPRCLQPKPAVPPTLRLPHLPQPPNVSNGRPSPQAPPAYRPQPAPRVLQGKTALNQQPPARRPEPLKTVQMKGDQGSPRRGPLPEPPAHRHQGAHHPVCPARQCAGLGQKPGQAIQRTTVKQVKDWMENRWDKDKAAMEKFIRKPLEDIATKKGNDADIGDGNTILKKLNAIDSQMYGHFVEVGYGVEKIAKGRGFVRFGAYEYQGQTYGADVSSDRDDDEGTPRKAVQIKAVSAESSSGVLTVIKKASKQLAGATASGEKPHPDDQRVIEIFINNARNNFPYTAKGGVVVDGDFSSRTAKEIRTQIKARVDKIKKGLHEKHIDKIKISYTPPRETKDKTIRSIAWSREGGIRSDEEFRSPNVAREFSTTRPEVDKWGNRLAVPYSPMGK